MNSAGIPDFSCQALYEYLQDQASLILLLLDSEGRIIMANRYFRDLVGRDASGELFAGVMVDFSSSFDFKKVTSQSDQFHLLNITSYTGLPQTYYFRFLEHDENYVAVGELNQLEVENLRKNFMDLNNEFSNLNRELQKKNAELTRLNELKNHFLGMAAHDLRNPIGAILNLSEFLLEEARERLSREHINFISIINSSSRFMLSLLNELLDIARIEAGRLDLNIEQTDLVALIRSCIDVNSVLAEKKGISIDFNNFEDLPLIELDPLKIEQVMHNLLSNAIKFSPADTRIMVSVFLSGEYATVSIADQGPGIPDQEIQKLYQPFSKISVKSTAGEKSTGLGLAIAQKIITGHLGKIWVESKINRGSTFYFSIPLESNRKKDDQS